MKKSIALFLGNDSLWQTKIQGAFSIHFLKPFCNLWLRIKVFFLRPEKEIYVPYTVYSHGMQYSKCTVHENNRQVHANKQKMGACRNQPF
jgi:hypothetical protein